ncbi:MAG: Cyclin-dependent kinase-like 2, partial [Paramarteilia canceri]
SLNHDNVVTLLDVFKRNRRLYLVFEYIEYSLLDFMERSKTGISLSSIKKILYQICQALLYMHQNDVIHRDLKPENVLLTEFGFVKLCDLGFARSVSGVLSRCGYTEYVATRWYRAPELLIGDTRYG